MRGIRIGEAAHPGPGRDNRRRRRVISSDDEVGSDDAPLVPPTVVDDVECTQWESGSSFSLPSRMPVSVSNRFTALEDDRPGPKLHVLSEGICSAESDTESVEGEKLCHHDERLVRVRQLMWREHDWQLSPRPFTNVKRDRIGLFGHRGDSA